MKNKSHDITKGELLAESQERRLRNYDPAKQPCKQGNFDAHIYSERIDEFEDRPDNRGLQPEIEILCLEENTRGLLQAVMSSVSSILSHPSTSV